MTKIALRLLNRPRFTTHALLVISSIYMAIVCNLILWQKIYFRMSELTVESAGFCLALFLLLSLLIYLLVLPFSHRRVIKPAISLLLITCAFITYFNGIGVVIDVSMVESILHTNFYEAKELLNVSLISKVVVLGFLPSILLFTIDIVPQTNRRALTNRFAWVSIVFVSTSLLVFGNFHYVSYFGRQNSDLKVYLNPLFPLDSGKRYIADKVTPAPTFQEIGQDARQNKVVTKRRIGIFVVGETARSDHFQINGYSRNTTPKLSIQDVDSFTNVESCGTSTAYSVPCIFSFLTASEYSPNKAKKQSNLLDVLEVAGIKTLWRDNNSSCKGVCNNIESENFRDHIDSNSPYYNDGEYLDDVLLSDLDAKIDATEQDMLIVLHQLGSHGPAYHKRYPSEFSIFMPMCQSSSPHTCAVEEVVNSYDNTIAYTDHFLNEVINFLKSRSDKFDSFMFYVSDHGESLGENGIYLHGLPRMIAPESQTHVPLVVWMSESLKTTKKYTLNSTPYCESRPLSHDNVVHSVLSLLDVETQLRETEKEIFSPLCDGSIMASNP